MAHGKALNEKNAEVVVVGYKKIIRRWKKIKRKVGTIGY